MSIPYNLLGRQFGYLTVVERLQNYRKDGRVYWLCNCKCGKTNIVPTYRLTDGTTKSCGCRKFESHNATHGMKHTRIYDIWCGIVQRCYNPNNKSYSRYGARGITMCDIWRNSFESFNTWAIENGYTENLTIDRIDNNGNYSPDNCRWTDFETQMNNRRSNIRIQNDGKDLTLAQWCRLNGANYKASWAKRKKIIEEKGVCTYEDIFLEA